MNARAMFREIDALALRLRQERDAKEAARESLQVKARAIESPAYDNSDLFSLPRWTARNLDALAAYFKALGATPDELPVMTAIQYERQLQLREWSPSPMHHADRDTHEQDIAAYRRACEPHESGLPRFGEI